MKLVDAFLPAELGGQFPVALPFQPIGSGASFAGLAPVPVSEIAEAVGLVSSSSSFSSVSSSFEEESKVS